MSEKCEHCLRPADVVDERRVVFERRMLHGGMQLIAGVSTLKARTFLCLECATTEWINRKSVGPDLTALETPA